MAIETKRPTLLHSGAHLTQPEFHRRYSVRPDIKKAELVEGIVYVAPPAGAYHGKPHALVVGWLMAYVAKHSDVEVGDNGTAILDADNEVQPDAFLWRAVPGGPRLDEQGYLLVEPQLVVEVAASSAPYDLHEKYCAYRRNRVREYVVWRVLDGAIGWFRLRDGDYVLIKPDARDLMESEQFPVLRLHVAKMLANDGAGVLAER